MHQSINKISRVALLSTGTEILQGLYADTNARYLAEQLSSLGLKVVASAAAPDDADEIESALRMLAPRADLIVCTGGLGPTEDDVNRDVFARVFNVELVADPKAISMMEARFRLRGKGAMPERNAVQALVPRGSRVLYNDWGTAPGFFLPSATELDERSPYPGVALIALPGPPKEMMPMFQECVLPILRERIESSRFVQTRTLHTIGRPESSINQATSEFFRRDPNVTYTLLAKGYGVDIRITANAATADEMKTRLAEFEEQVRAKLKPADVYGVDSETLEGVVANLLLAKKRTVAAAESCTGGLVAKFLTDTPGSSGYLNESYVTYSNEAKEKLLNVSKETLRIHGAVSVETVSEMAAGVRQASGADFGLAVTGIAGPGGGTSDKPVGLAYIGLATGTGIITEKHRLLGDREQNRLSAALAALNLLRLQLLKLQ